jgi:hypothetical protein
MVTYSIYTIGPNCIGQNLLLIKKNQLNLITNTKYAHKTFSFVIAKISLNP